MQYEKWRVIANEHQPYLEDLVKYTLKEVSKQRERRSNYFRYDTCLDLLAVGLRQAQCPTLQRSNSLLRIRTYGHFHVVHLGNYELQVLPGASGSGPSLSLNSSGE